MSGAGGLRGRTLQPRQRARVMIVDVETARPECVFESADLLLEAPNWTADGGALILNGAGRLWRLELASAELAEVPLRGVPSLNNDHVIAPGGKDIFLSAEDGHIYTAPLSGGDVVRVTQNRGGARRHYLHGVSPDGLSLAYVGLEPWAADGFTAGIFVLDLGDGRDVRLTDGVRPDDGCEYTPSGDWIWFNTERFTREPGHAQLARMRPDGSDIQRRSWNDRVDWFPHPSPDGKLLSSLSYEKGTIGHPADRLVEIHVAELEQPESSRTLAVLPGGQGTINVNSWAPDSRRLAYVEYPGA